MCADTRTRVFLRKENAMKPQKYCRLLIIDKVPFSLEICCTYCTLFKPSHNVWRWTNVQKKALFYVCFQTMVEESRETDPFPSVSSNNQTSILMPEDKCNPHPLSRKRLFATDGDHSIKASPIKMQTMSTKHS